MNRLLPVALLVLASCGSQPVPPPLEGARIGGSFALVDQYGRETTDRSFAGRYRIMYFGYTYCPDVCPVDMATLAAGLGRFAEQDKARADKVRLIFVSVDPERDTPAVLKTFTKAFGPSVSGLTGSPEAVAAAAKAYAITYRRQPPSVPGGAYLVDHSRVAYLMDPANRPVALLPQDGKAQDVADALAKWVT